MTTSPYLPNHCKKHKGIIPRKTSNFMELGTTISGLRWAWNKSGLSFI